MRQYHSVAVILVVIGALNLGLMGLAGINLLGTILGSGTAIERALYILVGVSGVWLVWNHWMAPAKSKAKK